MKRATPFKPTTTAQTSNLANMYLSQPSPNPHLQGAYQKKHAPSFSTEMASLAKCAAQLLGKPIPTTQPVKHGFTLGMLLIKVWAEVMKRAT